MKEFDMAKYSVRLTRETTESLDVVVDVDDSIETEEQRIAQAEKLALDKAGRYGEDISGWEIDEGNFHSVYLPDEGNATRLPDDTPESPPIETVENLTDGVIPIVGEHLGTLGDVCPSYAENPFQQLMWNSTRYWGLRRVRHKKFGVVFQALVCGFRSEPVWINLRSVRG